ncbi:MAG: TonB-dependent receptor [Verrucomicrobia bacterium]|nr:TonB-dependent receptor [Verrucomicrobiota bacterium]
MPASRLAMAFLLVLTATDACGDDSDTGSNSPMDRVIVTATRTALDESQIGSAFSQLTGEELQTEQIADLKNALNTTPGVFSLETGARGGLTTVSIRGNDPSYSLILVDGMRVNTGIFDNAEPFLAYAQTFNLDTIDIVRGPYSTLYGSDAIGGVISAVTHEGSGAPKATVFGEYGTYDSIRAGIISDGVIGKIHYSFDYVHDETANARFNNHLREDGYSFRLDVPFTPDLTFGVTARGEFGRYGEPSSNRPVDIPFDDPHGKATGETNLFTVFLNWTTTDWWQQHFLVGGFNERYTFIDPPIPSEFFTGTVYIGKAFNLQTDWQNTFQITSKNVAVAGATYYLEAGHDNSFPLQQENNFAAYLQDQWEILPNLTLIAGGRYDHYQLAGDAFTYRFSGAYLFDATKTKLRASYGTAFKAPNLFDTFSTSPFALGNRNLKPETSQGYDVGIDQYLWSSGVTLSVSFFQNYIHDVIAFVPTSPVTGTYANQNSGETYGLESEIRANLTKDWQTRAAFTWTESNFTVAGVTQRNPDIPRYLLSLDTNYKFFHVLTVGFGALYSGQQVAADFSFSPAKYVRLNDYWVLRTYARWELNDHIAFTFRVENLSDQHYYTTIGFPALGTAVFGGAEVRF